MKPNLCRFNRFGKEMMETTISTIVDEHAGDATRLIDILHALQNHFGFLSTETVEQTAHILNIPRSQIHSVIAFYSFLHSVPVGTYRILLSDCIIDTLHGFQTVMDAFCHKLGIQPDEIRSDGKVSIATASCTGFCDQGPAALINGVAIQALDINRVDIIVNLIEMDVPISEWPTDLFSSQDNIHQRGFLLQQPIEVGSAILTLLDRGIEDTLIELEQSGLRGCGGAGFPTVNKWRFCRRVKADTHYVVCNADEGEPGTFKDRVLLNNYADQVIEGMTLCARIIGAAQGFIYLRAEYLFLRQKLQQIIDQRRQNNSLGHDIAGVEGFNFDIEIRMGAGAYICGEESALLESLEGKRGVPRIRPPFPVTHGYLDKPTVVNNVETFAAAAKIAVAGSQSYNQVGTEQSPGSRLLSISGDCARPGIYEYPFGTTIEQVLTDCGADNTLFVQVGGPSGTLVANTDFQRNISFEDLPTGGSFMIFDDSRDPLEIVINFAHFFAHESCGFCTPCRVGTMLMKKTLDKIVNGAGSYNDLEELKKLGHLTKHYSHCGLGQTAANPVMDTLANFPECYQANIKDQAFTPAIDLERALQQARQLTGRTDADAYLEQFNE